MITSHTQLKELRIKKELTQEQLAFILGTSKTYIKHLEQGLFSKVSLKVILSYCHFFNLSFNDLFHLFNGIIDKSQWAEREQEVALIKLKINPIKYKRG